MVRVTVRRRQLAQRGAGAHGEGVRGRGERRQYVVAATFLRLLPAAVRPVIGILLWRVLDLCVEFAGRLVLFA
ncbi:hypothetical protein ABZ565_23940 [Streptomyces sp. NPDC016469]|uniref:hypothetical protein n=1 Tax=Streptomyces sp. NPDC016469 TaxID=3157191 RepID=UPI003409104A